MDSLIHRAFQVAVVAMIAVTSIAAYHFWWRQRHHWHRMVDQKTIWEVATQQKPSSAELVFQKDHRSIIDWMNVLADAEEKGAPVASLAATVWLERRRKELRRKK